MGVLLSSPRAGPAAAAGGGMAGTDRSPPAEGRRRQGPALPGGAARPQPAPGPTSLGKEGVSPGPGGSLWLLVCGEREQGS